MTDELLYDTSDGITVITINRAQRRNALSPAVRSDCSMTGDASQPIQRRRSQSSPAPKNWQLN